MRSNVFFQKLLLITMIVQILFPAKLKQIPIKISNRKFHHVINLYHLYVFTCNSQTTTIQNTGNWIYAAIQMNCNPCRIRTVPFCVSTVSYKQLVTDRIKGIAYACIRSAALIQNELRLVAKRKYEWHKIDTYDCWGENSKAYAWWAQRITICTKTNCTGNYLAVLSSR